MIDIKDQSSHYRNIYVLQLITNLGYINSFYLKGNAKYKTYTILL